MYTIHNQTIDQHLLSLAQRGNREFNQRLHPNIPGVLGVRIPDLRKLAKDIIKSGTQEDYLQEAERLAVHYVALEKLRESEQKSEASTQPEVDFGWMEARTLHGLVLSQWRVTDVADYLQRVARWVPSIHSWSVCDTFSFSGGKRWVAAHEGEVWSFILPYFSAQRTYEIRFAVVMGLQYFAKQSHLAPFLAQLAAITHEDYYVRMAVAWAVAECFTHCPEDTQAWLAQNLLPVWTHNKAIQKIRESYRIDAETKRALLSLKRPVEKSK